MSSRHITRSLLILVAFLLLLAACRRGQPEAVPTLASPAEIEPTEAAAPAEPTAEPAAEAEPTAAPIVARPVPVEDIDWPPQVIASDPRPGQEVGLETPITVRFDQPMDQSSVEAAFTLDPPVAGELSWPEPDTAVFTPAEPLELGQTYNVRIADSAGAANGQTLSQPVEFAIQATGPLQVTQVIPADNAGTVQTDAIITVVFDKPVVPLLSSGEQSGLPQPLTFDPPATGTGEWTATSIYRFMPDPPLAGATTYTVSVDPALTDLTGSPLADAPTWSFTTLPPDVVLTEPENEKARVAPDASILVIFNMPMDMGGVEAATSLANSDGAAVPVTFAWRDNRSVDITPVDPLPLGDEYTLTVAAAATDINGAATMEDDHVSTFSTIPLPAILNTYPADGAVADMFGNGFSIEFASPMNDETIEDQLIITPTPEDVDYFISQWDEGYSVYVQFTLTPDTEYTVTVPASAADPYGNTLGEDFTFTFTAAPIPPMASFNLPREVAQLSTSFPSDVQVLSRNIGEVTVELYDIGVDTNLVFNTYLMYEQEPTGEPIFRTTITPTGPADELSVSPVQLAAGGVLPTGLYRLRVTSPELSSDTNWWQNRNVLLVVGDTNLVIKEMYGEVNVWATDLATGEPVGGLDLTLYRRSGEEAGTAVTDANGFARFDYDPAESYLEGVAVVANEPGAPGFGLASTLWTGNISVWNLGLTVDTGPEQALFAYIYTDRPIYRPGDTVFFKGIVRHPQFGRYELPDVTELELSVNPNFFMGEEGFSETFTVTLDEDGVFAGEFALPDDMPLGTYSFNITGDFWLSSRTFTVAEYRAPEFEVLVTPEQPELLRGAATNVTVNATYLFGGSAAGLPVTWNITAVEFVPTFEVNPPFTFGDSADFNYVVDPFVFGGGGLEENVGSGNGETDAAGNVTIPLPAEMLDELEAGSRQVTVEATVGGLGEFPVTGRATVTFHSADAYVGLRAANTLVDAGDEVTIDLLSVDWAGEPLGNQAVEVVFYEREWESERVAEFGMRTTRWTPVDTEVGRQSVTTDAGGEATATFTPESGGMYLAVATLTDGGGRQQLSSLGLWSVDETFAGWRTDPNMRTMEVTPDRNEYRAGETARVLVQSPFAQPVNAWLVIERGNIIDQQVVTVSGSQVLEIPITEAYAPNVHITVVAIKPVDPADADFPYADIRIGFAELTVPPDQFDLNVTITPGAEEYAPGDTATFDVVVTDQAGAPVQAEVSLSLVDLAVLLLKEDNAPHILEAFYSPQPLRSTIGSGLLVTGEGLEIEEPLPGGGGGGGGGADEGLESLRLPGEDDVRRDFRDTAYWEAKVLTDADGRVSVEVPLPDNVTTWRMHSKAATTDTRVGQASADILARLPLIIRPVTPRFFTVGDTLSLGANVNNNTDAAIEATVTLEASGLAIDGPTEQTVTVPADGRVLVTWPVTVEDVASADLTFRVAGGDYSDASKPTLGIGPDALLPIYRYDGRDFVATAGELDEAGRRVEAVVLPQGVNQTQGEVLVRLQPSLAAAIVESFEVINDPVVPFIECAGSLADRLLHNTAVEMAIRDLDLDMADMATTLAERNAADAAKLAALQMAGGGWGWCFSAESDPWISAQSLLALTRAAELGYEVDATVIDSGAEYVSGRLAPVNQLGDASEANRQAFFLYVVAQAGEDILEDADELVAEHRALLDPYAKALLALAYDAAGATGDNQDALLTDLNDEVIMSATGAHWEDDETDFLNLSSDIRGTAMVVEALAQLQPDSPLLPPAVRWLMVARQAETWSTLHTTAWSVSALSKWMAASGELEPDYAYELLVNLQSRAAGSFTPDDPTAAETVEIPLSELLTDDTNFFDFQRGEGDGRLYYTLRLNSAIAVEQLDPISRGFTVARRYFDAACDPATETCEPIAGIAAGERVRVELTVIVPNDRVYVLVEDPIPAGTDAIDPNLLTSESGRGGSIVPAENEFADGFWGWWYFDHIQYRDEKVVFLSQFLPAGTYQYTYFLQPNIPGTYQVMPATAREDYFPEVFGRSEGAIFTITE
ncbi:putative Alpha-2-macroglobulin domain protein [Candidatus Promineifilum breve]|uniref:Alpha-2-macroglobulin domain protein n=1 Tax=Candidatus Promineifilum breve TaxID=1806508 RepID=A0A160T6A6_9CHLR|nr:Ig-like domain-containing alpha-2-macroglobulin family protein [Candidatus Promineifilum breve]CUS05059.2 putative Alpha-2-macroglobulin domain protein [Candidatus Promineifilum breve]